MAKRDPWIQTLDGQQAWIEDPSGLQFDPRTIATALSRIARFNGHTTRFYSVAEHSVGVMRHVPKRLKLPALLHDAHEAFTGFGDVCRPAKQLFTGLAEIESRWDVAIAKWFGFSPSEFKDPKIKEADMRMLATEKRDLMSEEPSSWGDLPPPYCRKIWGKCSFDSAENMFHMHLTYLQRDIEEKRAIATLEEIHGGKES